jgi:hypothetical protein
MKLAGNVTPLRKIKDVCRILVRKPEGKRQLGRLSADGRAILEWIIK